MFVSKKTFVSRKSFSAILAGAVLAGGLGLAAPAMAAPAPTALGCLKMAKEVRGALDRHAQDANYAQAENELKVGQDYCTKGYHKIGMSHYETALKMIGAASSASR